MSDPPVQHDPSAGSPKDAPVVAEPRCRDCGAGLTGSYCAACGMPAGAPDASSVQLLREGLVEALELDGRLARTLPALFLRPGALMHEFAEGRRRRWTSPARLLTFAFLVGFGALQLAGDATAERIARDYQDSLVVADAEGLTVNLPLGGDANVTVALQNGSVDPTTLARLTADPRQFVTDVFELALGWAPWVMVALLVPGTAVMFEVLFRRVRFVDHLVLSVHLHAVALFGLAGFTLVPGGVPVLIGVLALWLGVALTRLHGQRRILRALGIFAAVALWSAAAAATPIALLAFAVARTLGQI